MVITILCVERFTTQARSQKKFPATTVIVDARDREHFRFVNTSF